MFPDSRSSASPGELTKWNFLHRWFPVRAKSEFGLALPQLCWSPECERQLEPGAPPRWQSCSFKVLLSVGKQGQSGSLSGSEELVHPNARGHSTTLVISAKARACSSLEPFIPDAPRSTCIFLHRLAMHKGTRELQSLWIYLLGCGISENPTMSQNPVERPIKMQS